MRKEFVVESISYDSEYGKKAAELFACEILARTGKKPEISCCEEASFCFRETDAESKEKFRLTQSGGKIEASAGGLRGLIYAFARFLKNTEYENGRVYIVGSPWGEFEPDKSIRGHQLGYRTTPNTYDAWSFEDYGRYYLDMLFMGCNTVEHMPSGRRNGLMKYEQGEFLVKATQMADELDLDVSMWYPNLDEETDESAAESRKKMAELLPRFDVIFPPGGDPGELPPEELLQRIKVIMSAVKSVKPDMQMWPSAQAPHSIADWGERFAAEMAKEPDEIDGIIMGPNHAFPLDELRRKIPVKYPIRFYPDITHNLRCEYPVHFPRDDWHFALAAGLSRECTNPRPLEYAALHKATSRYLCGSVSYSEGITDDVNKFVWSALDFDGSANVRTILTEYSRLFFWGAPSQTVADAILRLEANWQGDPAENPGIDTTLEIFTKLSCEYPFLNGNWRFDQLLLRAECDAFIRLRRLAETDMITRAEYEIDCGNLDGVEQILSESVGDECAALRKDIDRLCEDLFNEIGYQSSVEKYGADGWERGAILDTIDNQVSDRAWLLNRIGYAREKYPDNPCGFMKAVFNRNRLLPDEFYYSTAIDGLEGTGVPQQGEVYINVLADRPHWNNGGMPLCMSKIFDNCSFRLKTGGFIPGVDYKLTVTYVDEKAPEDAELNIYANGKKVYCGPFENTINRRFAEDFCSPGAVTVEYPLPADAFENGCLELLMEEKTVGVIFSELRITRA